MQRTTFSLLTFVTPFSRQLQLHRPQVHRWGNGASTPLLQHVSQVIVPGVPQDGEEYWEGLLPTSLQVYDQLSCLFPSGASTLQRREGRDKAR